MLWRPGFHETSHCVSKNGPGLPLSSPIQCSVTTASDSSRWVRHVWETAFAPPPAPDSWDLVASRARCVCVCQAGDSSQRRGRPDAARPVPEALRSLVCPGLRRSLISILSGPVPRVLPRERSGVRLEIFHRKASPIAMPRGFPSKGESGNLRPCISQMVTLSSCRILRNGPR